MEARVAGTPGHMARHKTPPPAGLGSPQPSGAIVPDSGYHSSKMHYAADPDGVLAALRSASALGAHIVDAADVYAWGLTRELAAVRAACCARIAATAGRSDRTARAVSDTYLRNGRGQ